MRNLLCILLMVTSIVSISCTHSNSEETDDDNIPEAPLFYKSHESSKKEAPFSDVVQVGDFFFLSGQIGMDHSTRQLVDGGIEAETKQTLENIKDVLQQYQLEMSDVVKATVILDTIEDFSEFNMIYTQYFPQKPARTTFAAEALARGARIEIEVIAVRSSL